jgi:hypothetical protein
MRLLQNPDSWAGKKLLRRGVAHVGAWITQLHRLRLVVPGDKLNRQGLLACSAQGSLLLLCPLWDDGLFRRLQSLQVGAGVHTCYAALLCKLVAGAEDVLK